MSLSLSAAPAAAGNHAETHPPVTNDTTYLRPITKPSQPVLTFNFPGFHIGTAEYAEGPTGCTVFYFPEGASAAADVRGGSPGTLMAGDGYVDAICYAGGSLLGLEAATGVASELFARRRFSTEFPAIPVVRGAIIYNFGPRETAVYPDKALGRAALKAASPGVFPLGPRGAGRSASCGPGFDFDMAETTGQGGAFRVIGPTKMAAFAVVNALGAIHNRQGKVVRGFFDRKTGRRSSYPEMLDRRLAAPPAAGEPHQGNTNLTVIVTNQKLDPKTLAQLSRQVHSSMARAIQPFHSPYDGDVLYAVTTNEVDNPALDATSLGVAAAELAWDAVLSSFIGS